MIGKTGKVTGNIKAGSAQVMGALSGDVTVSNTLTIHSEGSIAGNNGKTADCKNITLFLTTNLGADKLEKNVMGFNASTTVDYDDKDMKKYFAPILIPSFESCVLLSWEIVFSVSLNFSIG